jgi:hypothetical protein
MVATWSTTSATSSRDARERGRHGVRRDRRSRARSRVLRRRARAAPHPGRRARPRLRGPRHHAPRHWSVRAVAAAVGDLEACGVAFARYAGFEQDEQGIWTAPTGARFACSPTLTAIRSSSHSCRVEPPHQSDCWARPSSPRALSTTGKSSAPARASTPGCRARRRPDERFPRYSARRRVPLSPPHHELDTRSGYWSALAVLDEIHQSRRRCCF